MIFLGPSLAVQWLGLPLMIQWLGLHASNGGLYGFNPWLGN